MALAALLFPGAAWADTVVLDDGAFTLKVGLGTGGQAVGKTLEASGPGLSLDVHAGGDVGPGCAGTCAPGSFFIPNMFSNEATFGTVTYAGATYMINSFTLTYEVGGAPILFPPLAATFSASVPFDIQINTVLCDSSLMIPPPPCSPGIHVNAIGQGVATFSFIPDTLFPTLGDWVLESGIYEIQPIPEPGTWLLVPTAVGLAWLARKRGQGRRRLPYCLSRYGS
jgi:hypothetical protein